ncbi:putative protein phosphatase 2c 5 [Quercus suber]|uniref:Uncharacterized protein n=1 Tax=Quercus suber TaxID=58331 RepID=A0AAW0JMI0_QUESU
MLRSLLFGKKAQNFINKSTNKLSAVGAVEELFEEVLQCLQKVHLLNENVCRLGKDFLANTNSGLFLWVVCQVDQAPVDGLLVNSRPFFSPTSKPWEGPFLCANYWKKKDAMEGKRASRSTTRLCNFVQIEGV